ncbi:hypothetical protein EV424DRAFT_1473622 [Suillus variegatus]|nr:hypothetical protein EV424DRAFT_1473622 [Suillus variegatus]
MFQCPSCGKGGFKDDIAVAHHMNQPRSGCSTWLQDIIQLQTDYSMSIDDPHMPHDSDLESHQDHYHDQPEGLGNLYYPFSGRKEWEVVSWLLHLGLSMGKINSFLSLEMIKDLSLLFPSAKELRGRAEMLPSGPCWMSQVIPTAHPTKLPLDFMPCRVYTTAQRLYRVYSEWMTANDAWKMQSNLPSGATLLGTILSSDKTNISMMTGDRVAHPLLISLANIHMSTRLKASSGAFLLTALLPDHLIHQCLDIVLVPLKQAAREGVMLSDPVGHIAPNNIEVFFHEAQKFRLNGVDKPFWLDWVMAEPSHFLTLEILHHLHQAFYDHDAKWIICAVGEAEIDFHFSVLQPVTGFHHFHSRISKLKQVTGHAQCDIQHSIIAAAADAVPSIVITAIRALMDFRYLVQSTRIEDRDLQRISTALAEFHANKQAILDAEFRRGKSGKQSIAPSIRNTGVAMQWTADTTEHAHICCHLDCADKCRRFELAVNLLDLSNQHAYLDEDNDDIDIDIDDDHDILATILLHKEVGTIPQLLRTFVVGQCIAIHLAYDPSIRALFIDDTALKFNLPNLQPALADFLHCKDTYGNDHIHTIGGARRAGPDASLPFDKMQIWFKVQLQDMDIHNASIVQPAQTLNCAPPCDLWTSGRYDTVIVNHEEGYSWPADGLHGHSIAQIRLIMRPIGKRGAEWLWKDHFLTYVKRFDIGDREPAMRLHLLKRAKRSNGTWIGDIIPVTQFRVPVNVVPCFGASADNRLTPYNSTEHSSEFWLNRYWDKNTFFPLSM